MKAIPYANNQKVRIHYKVESKGPSLVLLYGSSGSLEQWYDLGYVNLLKNDYQLILLDIRGNGASDKPHAPEAYKLSLLVGDIVAVLDDLNVSMVYFLGYSMGGRIGFGVAKYAPKRFYSFIVGGAHPYQFDPNEHQALLQLFKQEMEAVIAALEKMSGRKMPSERKERLTGNASEALAAFWSTSHWPDLEDVLPTMTMPYLVFVGEADPLYLGVKECVKKMPKVTFISFPDLAHFDVLPQRHMIFPYITKFLAKVSQT
ncbi:MAG: alpha/beta fold hydrolase [Candidatus Heimdallarchaeota archaeon]